MRELYIGLLSGTSMDSVDAVIVDFSQQKPQLIETHSERIDSQLHHALHSLTTPGMDEINQMAVLDIKLGQLFAHTVKQLLSKAKLTAEDIKAIGSHGQTIRHAPNHETPFTLQVGDPNVIAAQAGVTTVADFRRKDIALGGQGAPLTPAFNEAFLRTADQDRIILNIGGIANITWLPADPNEPVIGYDTGPGNTLLDAWIRAHKQQRYDEGGTWAQAGKLIPGLLDHLLSDTYFCKALPKSTGPEYFHLEWLNKHIALHQYANEDVQATLTHLTALSITSAIADHTKNANVLTCGGGTQNTFLMKTLQTSLGNNLHISTTDDHGLPSAWMEAMAFAWLAKNTLERRAGNLPSVTGAKREAVLGGVYYP